MSYTEIMAYIVLLWIVTGDGVEVMSQFENLYLIFLGGQDTIPHPAPQVS